MHTANKHKDGYDLQRLSHVLPELQSHIIKNPSGRDTIDFFNALSVKTLNRAILIADYGMTYWDVPPGYLCPPVPGRADYVHAMAELLAKANNNIIPRGPQLRCLDIGTGANAVYPIIGIHEYQWRFVGTDIDAKAIKNISLLIEKNKLLADNLEIRTQQNPNHFFQDIIRDERFDCCICNPPFFSDMKEAEAANKKKLSKLKHQKVEQAQFNFAGQSKELFYSGGEKKFIKSMIKESLKFKHDILYFSTLVSRDAHIKIYRDMLIQLKVPDVRTLDMQQGQKKSRILVWSFLTDNQKVGWAKMHWQNKNK